jgi:RNA polymerase sigma-70 factor (ECF subfamily)
MSDRETEPAPDLRLPLLVLRCQTGDDRAFARLMEWFGPRTLRYLHGLVGDDAEDVQQLVWLSVHRGIGGLTNVGAFRTWLFRTTRHRAIDHLRRQRRESELLLDLRAADAVPAPEGAEEWEDHPSIEQLLDRLPILQREVILLRHRDGLSYGEIALIVGCSLGTVRSRLHYAKARLKSLLSTDSAGPCPPAPNLEEDEG